MCSSVFFLILQLLLCCHPIPLNSDLSDFKFRNNNGVPELSMDGGTTWQKVGGGMKLIKEGFVTSTTTVSLSEFNFSSSHDYLVITSGDASAQGGTNRGNGMTEKTSSGFTLTISIPTGTGNGIYYQVLDLR